MRIYTQGFVKGAGLRVRVQEVVLENRKNVDRTCERRSTLPGFERYIILYIYIYVYTYVCVYIYTHILYFLSYIYICMMNIWTRTTQFRVSCSSVESRASSSRFGCSRASAVGGLRHGLEP